MGKSVQREVRLFPLSLSLMAPAEWLRWCEIGALTFTTVVSDRQIGTGNGRGHATYGLIWFGCMFIVHSLIHTQHTHRLTVISSANCMLFACALRRTANHAKQLPFYLFTRIRASAVCLCLIWTWNVEIKYACVCVCICILVERALLVCIWWTAARTKKYTHTRCCCCCCFGCAMRMAGKLTNPFTSDISITATRFTFFVLNSTWHLRVRFCSSCVMCAAHIQRHSRRFIGIEANAWQRLQNGTKIECLCSESEQSNDDENNYADEFYRHVPSIPAYP